MQNPSQWHHGIPTSAVPMHTYPHSTQAPIIFAAHPTSMPIPVPIPTHQHGAAMMIPQQAYQQQAHLQAALTYPTHTYQMQAGYHHNPQMSVEGQPGMSLMHMIGQKDYMDMQQQ